MAWAHDHKTFVAAAAAAEGHHAAVAAPRGMEEVAPQGSRHRTRVRHTAAGLHGFAAAGETLHPGSTSRNTSPKATGFETYCAARLQKCIAISHLAAEAAAAAQAIMWSSTQPKVRPCRAHAWWATRLGQAPALDVGVQPVLVHRDRPQWRHQGVPLEHSHPGPAAADPAAAETAMFTTPDHSAVST